MALFKEHYITTLNQVFAILPFNLSLSIKINNYKILQQWWPYKRSFQHLEFPHTEYDNARIF